MSVHTKIYCNLGGAAEFLNLICYSCSSVVNVTRRLPAAPRPSKKANWYHLDWQIPFVLFVNNSLSADVKASSVP